MNIEEMRKKEADLIDQIAALLVDFTKETGLIVDEVLVDAFSTDMVALPEKIDIYLVSVTLRL